MSIRTFIFKDFALSFNTENQIMTKIPSCGGNSVEQPLPPAFSWPKQKIDLEPTCAERITAQESHKPSQQPFFQWTASILGPKKPRAVHNQSRSLIDLMLQETNMLPAENNPSSTQGTQQHHTISK
jgi:hypothetical protein